MPSSTNTIYASVCQALSPCNGSSSTKLMIHWFVSPASWQNTLGSDARWPCTTIFRLSSMVMTCREALVGWLVGVEHDREHGSDRVVLIQGGIEWKERTVGIWCIGILCRMVCMLHNVAMT
jgi:hypothetical protein